MVRDLITLPLRAGVYAARLGFRFTEQAVILPLRVAERLIEAVMASPHEAAGAEGDGDAPAGVRVAVVVTPPAAPRKVAPASRRARTPEAATPIAAAPAAPEADAAPAHVSEDAELVESFAEPGAEDGAGAAVHVDEPWEGYRGMTANEIVARLADASREELAAVELYERLNRNRRTVLAAADRDLRRATAAARGAARK